MGFGAVVQYSSATFDHSYTSDYEWVIGGDYIFQASEKLSLNLGAVYGINDSVGDDHFVLGAEATYAATDTLAIAGRIRYFDDGDTWDGRIRFTASF